MVNDKKGKLYRRVADVIFEFIEAHLVSFPNALASKADFKRNKPYKRAMVFVFMCRFCFCLSGQKQWKKFSQKYVDITIYHVCVLYLTVRLTHHNRDYKLNVRLFNKWLSVDEDVMKQSKKYMKLSDTATPSKRKRVDRGRHKASGEPKSSSMEEPEPLTTCVVEDDFTDDEMSFELAPSENESKSDSSGSGSGSGSDES